MLITRAAEQWASLGEVKIPFFTCKDNTRRWLGAKKSKKSMRLDKTD